MLLVGLDQVAVAVGHVVQAVLVHRAQSPGHYLGVDSRFQSDSHKSVAKPVERQVKPDVPLDDTGWGKQLSAL